MPDARYQGAFAESYITTLALAAGLNPSTAKIDDDGVDIQIGFSGPIGEHRSPEIKMQVKSWSTPSGSGDHWSFDRLNEVQYNLLVGPGFTIPRFLAVVIVPADRELFAEVVDDGMLMRHHAYFLAMEELPAVVGADARRRKTVRLPKRNRLDPAALRGLVHPGLVAQRSMS